MASACVNNIAVSPDNFLDSPAKFSSYAWLSPRISISRDDKAIKDNSSSMIQLEQSEPDLETATTDFEFRLDDPVTMLPADELFSDGKLVPLQLSTVRHSMPSVPLSSDVRSPDTPKFLHRSEISTIDPYLFSPKAPSCSSRWKDILGLRKLYNNKPEDQKTASSLSSHAHKNTARSLKKFLHRNSKSSSTPSDDSSLTLPLLKEVDTESVQISSRLSLSSSSSGHEHDDLPRHSLDSDKPRHQTRNNLSRVRVVKHRSSENPTRVGRSPIRRAPECRLPVRGVSVDSPRMNSSGKIIFHSLERSSSSPSTFNGGPRYKRREMERSYSANVRVAPVLNVPVCSIRGSSKSRVFGFPLFSSPQKKENGGNRTQHSDSRNRTDRTRE